MAKMLLGEKVGMTQVFDAAGNCHAVTVIKLGPCHVLQVKTADKHGYDAIQIGYKDKAKKQANQAETGHAAKAGVAPKRFVREVRLASAEDKPLGDEIAAGTELNVSLFEGVKAVDVVGTMKGRGFSGVMKRHGFSGLETGHGVQRKHRAPGSIGPSQFPGHVRKNIRMNGQYGNSRKTSRNIKVYSIDVEQGTMLVEGAVPGYQGSFVLVRETKKRPRGWDKA
ncbi:50S ribosomal protein L3 [bacterium]|jgi:large subunit ribosomal protein L3|nr:50S ribosomal protein L3 [bacterium]